MQLLACFNTGDMAKFVVAGEERGIFTTWGRMADNLYRFQSFSMYMCMYFCVSAYVHVRLRARLRVPTGTSPRQDSGWHYRRSGVTVGCTNGHTPRPRQRPTTHSSPAPCASRHSPGLDASSTAVRCNAASRPPGPIQHHGPPGPCSTGAMQLPAYTASWPPGPMQHGCYAASHPVATHR